MRYSALFISFFISLMSFSQNIQGIVTDQNNEPIAMAVIQLYENENIISYTTTNDDGTFHLENTRIGRYTLVANHWSFEKKTQDITLDNQDIKITITLEAKAFELEQVEVQSRAALAHKKGDTLTYNLNAIADGNERKIRELLNKLPGVKVDPITGKITANGKVIDDLLINGQKLFGNNHKLAVENIRAEILDEISLINNYETFSALKDIEGSDKTAMNLKIKDDYLGEITGEIELLGGYENRYKAHPKLFQFNKKYSLSVVANANNTAEESMTMYDFIELNSGIKSDIRNQNLSKTTSNTSFPSFLLADKNVSKKSNEFLSIYSVMQPNENWSINSYLIGNHAKINENILSRKNFYANNFLIEDTQESKTHNYNLQAKINSDYYFDRNALLNYTFFFSKNETNKTNYTINNLNNNPLNYNETQNPNYITLGQQLSFIKKVSRFGLISLNAYHEYKDNDNFLDIQANTMLFNTNNTVFAQKIVEKSHEFGGFGKYTHKLGKHILSASTGYNALFQKANYQNINEIKDNLDRKYLFSNLSITHKKTRFEYGAMAELRHYLTENKTFILPELIVKYHFKQDLHLVEAKYKREINFPTILNLNNIEYANDFRNYYMTSALDSNTEVLQNIYELHYLFMDLYRGITLFGYSKYLKNKDIITQNYNFTNNTNYITNQVANGGFQWINYINFSLNLFKIKQKIEISANYNLIDRPFYRNGFLDKNDIKSSSVEFNILSNFKNKPYSYIAGIQLKNTTNNIQNSGQKITLTEYIPKIDLTINFTKRITGYFNHNYHIASSDGLENNFWELNYKIYYQKEKSKWNWYITAENFLHLKGNNALNSAERNTYFETQQIGRLAGFIGLGCIFEF